MSLLGRLRRRYASMSIQMVISLSFTAVAVVGMVFMGLSLFWRFASTTDQMVRENSLRVLSQVNMNLDGYLRRMMRVSDAVYYRGIKSVDFAQRDISEALSLVYAENRDVMVSVAAFDSAGNLVTAIPLTTLKPEARPAGERWFRDALEGMENFHFSRPHVQNLFYSQEPSYPWVVTLSRHVELTRNGIAENGVLIVDMSFSGVEQICRDVELSGGGYIYLVDGDGEILYHPRQQLIYAGLLEENSAAAAAYQDGVHTERFGGETRQVAVKTVGYTGWKLVGVAPSEGLRGSWQVLSFGVSLLLFSIFLMAFLNLRISAYISDPVRKLEQAVKELEAGREQIELTEEGCYEVQRLSHSIRSMVSTMRHLMEDIVQQEKQKTRSELEVLQSQINPHFLYNTLDSVIWMTEAGNYRESIQMVTSLARLFRISLSEGKSMIALADELEHARHYMTIQQLRYKNRFTTCIEQAPDTAGLYCLKLIVQPILENAVYHGIAAGQDDGAIAVRAYREGDALVIDITDNGLGMPPGLVEGLLDENRPAVKSKGSGIGVRNVHRRIRLAFGREYGLTILSEPDEGTTVRICMPALNEPQSLSYRGDER